MADNVVPIIQATLAPIFLVNGAAIFLNFTQARLFRVIDRLRHLKKELVQELSQVDRDEAEREQSRHLRRAIILRNAVLFGVLVIAMTVVTTLLILTSGLDPALDPGRAPVWTFGIGLVCFFVALALVTTDAFLSVAAARGASVR